MGWCFLLDPELCTTERQGADELKNSGPYPFICF